MIYCYKREKGNHNDQNLLLANGRCHQRPMDADSGSLLHQKEEGGYQKGTEFAFGVHLHCSSGALYLLPIWPDRGKDTTSFV